jgi:hypothetical protein
VSFDSPMWANEWFWNGLLHSNISIVERPFDKQIKDYLLHGMELDALKEAADV